MKQNNAVIGGEGNGGIIYPEMHYGRDALTGAALFLSHLAGSGMPASQLRKRYPDYFISKNKISIESSTSPGHQVQLEGVMEKVAEYYAMHQINRIDGVKIDLPGGWIHLRKSNTEPIIRIYTEAGSRQESEKMAEEVMSLIRQSARR